MGTVASDLKSEREKRQISLAQIAAETRIGLRHLESLEEGRYRDLPGGMYNRAFLKAYCDYLAIDSADIMQRYENEIAPALDRPTKSKTRIPRQSSSFHISPVVIWGLLLIISATGLFFSRRWITAIFSPYFSHAPISSAPHEPVQVPQPAAPPQPQAASAPVVAAPAEPVPQADQPAPEPTPATAEPMPAPALAVPATPAEPPAAAASAKPLRLEITATEKCWISVNRDGSPALRKLMEAGEVQSFNASQKLDLIIGNAGGVRLLLNGKPARPLGKPGEVVKIQIDDKNFQEIQDQTAG